MMSVINYPDEYDKFRTMTYKETIEYLFRQLPVFEKTGGGAYKPGLDNAKKLDTLFEHPHMAYKTVHIGGTNGKGSTSHTLAAILQEAGYKVGLYTSPHLVDFRERIRINGEKIEEPYVVDFVFQYKANFEPIKCSFFELTMMMAFCYFRDQKVDIAIIEVGLGGELDSTNIISPILSIVTNVSIDHTQFLGNTIESIAKEKTGIIKLNTPVVVGESNVSTKNIFVFKANSVNAPIVFASEAPLVTDCIFRNNKWFYTTKKFSSMEGQLGGLAQVKNTNTILHAIDQLVNIGLYISDKSIFSGFKNVCTLTGLMGRWQVVQESPIVVCDTAHNEDGVKFVVKQLSQENYKELRIVIGFAKDKDVDNILSLLPQDAIYYFTNAYTDRALNSDLLNKRAQQFGLNGLSYKTVKDAYQAAIEDAGNNDFVFVGGSNFVVGEFLEEIESFK